MRSRDWSRQFIVFVSLLFVCFFSCAQGRLSGNDFLTKELLTLAKDPSMNPVNLWIDQGAQLWQQACIQCHQNNHLAQSAVVAFPKWKKGRLVNLEDQIVDCLSKAGRTNLSVENQDVIAISAHLSDQAKGLKVQVEPPIDSFEREQWQKELNHGTDIYLLRQGRVNLSCTQCHDLNIGKNLRSDVISPAYLSGFPIYRQTWQTMGTIDRRLRACYSGIQANIPASGHRDLRALELFLKKRSEGLTWEGPSIRR